MDGCPGFRQVRSGQSSKYMDFTIGKSVIGKDRIGSIISEEVMKKRAGSSKSNRPGLRKLTRHRAANLIGGPLHIYIYVYIRSWRVVHTHTHTYTQDFASQTIPASDLQRPKQRSLNT